MEKKVEYPPNYQEIQASGLGGNNSVYCYGDTIYNPHNLEIYPDIEEHEKIHQRQQGTDPEWWWKKYLYDPAFREEQEIEAYAYQVLWVKNTFNAKAAAACLDESAQNLAGKEYLLHMKPHQAHAKIRRKIKDIS